MPIQSFSDKAVAEFFIEGTLARKLGWRSLAKVAKRKLDLLHYAHQLEDIRVPPANHLEALKDDLKGYHSIRINDQWRVIFKWTPAGPAEVRIVDYH